MNDPEAEAGRVALAPRLEPATVIIPTRDRPALLAAALASVLGGELAPDEIVVVDQSAACDGSVERLAAATTSSAIRHVHATTVGVSRARNLGSVEATHEVLLFLDDDVLVESDWCRALRESVLAAGPDAVVSGRFEASEPEAPGAFAPSTTPDVPGRTFDRPASVDVLYTGNCAMRRSTLRSVGGFDARLGPGTRYPAAEDNDLAHRLLTSGTTIVFDPAARVLHRAWRPASDLVPLRWRYGRGQGAFLAKHLTDPAGPTRRRLIAEILRRGRRIGHAALRQRAALGPEAAYLAGLLAGAAEWIVRERVGGGGRAVADQQAPRG